VSKRFPRISTARVIALGTAVIAVYFLTTGAVNAIQGRQLSQQEDRLQQDIADLQSRYDRLQALKDYLNSDEYIESVAREELGLVKRGEEGIVVISSVPAPTPAPDEGAPSLWWDVLIR
jgi:cell division protein DivIC